MDPNETSLIARFYLGEYVKNETKDLVDRLITDGFWEDDFELAVTANDLSDDEHERLICALEKRNEIEKEWGPKLKEAATLNLNAFEWINLEVRSPGVSDVIVHDHLQLMRFSKEGVAWVSKRISYDGIEIVEVTNDEIIGRWFFPTAEEGIWNEFRLNLENGKILVGEEIKFG